MSFADDPDERRAQAGEYVLGTLDGETLAEFETALAIDADLRAEVGAWQDRLLGLARRAPPLVPPPALWARIATSIGGAEARPASALASATPSPPSAATPTSTPPAPIFAPASAPTPTRPPAAPRWWQRLGFWQGASAVAALAVLALATLLVLRPPAVEAPHYLALLQAPGGAEVGWVVEARAGGSLRLVPLAPALGGTPLPAGRALQFWTKPEGAAGPTSLGLVAAGTALTLPVSGLPALGERQLFEITLEPVGGSTLGRPTGPVLYVGRAVRL